jgi:hypothetical protein
MNTHFDPEPPTEIQILKYHRPTPPAEPEIANLGRLGYNHMCFAVDNLVAAAGS